MEVKSHVQMPKGLMKAFSHRTENGRCVYYLDLKDMKTRESKINELGTIKGWYDPMSEAILAQIYESPFIQETRKLREFSQGKIASYSFTPEIVEIFKNFIKVSMLRCNTTRTSAEKSSLTARIMPDAFKALYIPVVHATIPEFDIFEGYRFNCLVNRSNLNFIVPQNCLIYCSTRGIGYVILPISPKVAILYEPEELFASSLDEDGTLRYAAVEQGEEETIRRINLKAAKTERYFNNEFLIGAGREELEILKSDLSGEQK